MMLTRILLMRWSLSFCVYAGLFLAAVSTRATELATGLNAAEIKSAGAILGFGATHRAWTAHALPSSSLGLDLGLESAFVFRRQLLTQGDGNAVVPRVVPVPRLWLSWDFPFDLTFSGSLAPGALFDGVSSFGFGLQWFFYELPEFKSSVSVVAHYTYANSFADLKTHTMGLDVQASRDLKVWQPYVGVGLATNNISADPRIVGAGVKAGPYTLVRPHFFIGGRIDLISKLSVQLDVYGSKTSLGVLFANTF